MIDPSMIKPSQLRAARALLDWNRAECAQIVGVSPETIKNIEQEKFVPSPPTIEKILQGFYDHGVEFFVLHGVGMRQNIKQKTQSPPTPETTGD